MAEQIVVGGPGRIEIINVSDQPLLPESVRIETHYLGISAGTEMNAYRGGVNWASGRDPVTRLFHQDSETSKWQYPVSIGYANVGQIVETGSKVAGLSVGQMVYTTAGHQTSSVMPAAQVRQIAPGKDPRSYLFQILLTTALNIVHHARPAVGETVVVLGAGPVGLLTTAVLARSGAGRIIVFDPIATRRKMALQLGAHVALDPTQMDPALAVREHNEGQGADIAIEVSANERALQQAPRVVRMQGHVVLAALHSKPTTFHFGQEVHFNAIRFSSAHQMRLPSDMLATWDRPRREALVATLLDELNLLQLITHEFAFHDAAAAYALVDSNPDDLISAVIKCSGA